MKNSDVIEAFVNKQILNRTQNLHIEDNKLFMYNTILAEYAGDILVVNTTKYSATSSKYQNYLLRICKNHFNNTILVTNVPINSKHLING